MAKKSTNVVPVDETEKKPSRKWPVLVLAIFLSLSTLAGGLVISMGFDKTISLVSGEDKNKAHDTPADQKTGSTTGTEAKNNKALMVEPMKEIIVNITSISVTGRKSTRFLKLNVVLVFDESVDGAERITERRIYIRDAFQNYLRQLTERDLSGSIGVVRLKSELLRRVVAVTESDAAKEVLISDIIVQ